MTSFSYGDVFDIHKKAINIHDLNLMNNIRRSKFPFDNLNLLEKILGNISKDERTNYFKNGITVNEENAMIQILNGSTPSEEFSLPTNDVLYLKNKEQNEFTVDLMLDGAMLVGQYAQISSIEFDVIGIEVETIHLYNSTLVNNTLTSNKNKVKLGFSAAFFPGETELYYLLTLKYKEPPASWNRLVNITNLVMKSNEVEHYTLSQKVLVVPQITGGDVYTFQAIYYLASEGYRNDLVRIKPVNHSQQDNMFVIYTEENAFLKSGDVIFVVDEHLFGKTDKFRLRNYLCGWHQLTDVSALKYIAVYIDTDSETGNTASNVDYKYKYYDSEDGIIYDLEAHEGNKHNHFGYGSVKNPFLLTKSNVSVTHSEIGNKNIYNLLLDYL